MINIGYSVQRLGEVNARYRDGVTTYIVARRSAAEQKSTDCVINIGYSVRRPGEANAGYRDGVTTYINNVTISYRHGTVPRRNLIRSTGRFHV